MALPRYNQANVQLSAPTGGQGARASFQAQVQGASGLAQTLANFSSQLYQQGIAQVKTEAVDEAKQDVFNRKKEILDIRRNSKTEEEAQARIDKVVTGQKKTNFSLYGRAYNTAAESAYVNQVTTDAIEATNIAFAQSKGDPAIFKSMIQSFSNETINAAPTKEAAVVASQVFQIKGSEAYKTLAVAKNKEIEAFNKGKYEATLESLGKEYRTLSKNGNTIDANNIFTHIQASVQSRYNQGKISSEEANYEIQKVLKGAFVDTSKEELRNSPDKMKYLETFRNNKVLTVDETQKTLAEMHTMMEEENQLFKDREAQKEKFDEVTNKTIVKDLDMSILNGTMTDAKLRNALDNQAITLDEYDKYKARASTPGPSFSNPGLYNDVWVNLDITTEEDIRTMAELSYSDRLELIKEKQNIEKMSEAEKIKAGKWMSTNNGKQARTDIKAHFGFVEGTITGMTDINNKLTQDYATVSRMLFDQVEALPIEERGKQVLHISDKLLTDYKAGLIEGTKPFLTKIDEAKIKEQEAAAKAKEKIDGEASFFSFF